MQEHDLSYSVLMHSKYLSNQIDNHTGDICTQISILKSSSMCQPSTMSLLPHTKKDYITTYAFLARCETYTIFMLFIITFVLLAW